MSIEEKLSVGEPKCYCLCAHLVVSWTKGSYGANRSNGMFPFEFFFCYGL